MLSEELSGELSNKLSNELCGELLGELSNELCGELSRARRAPALEALSQNSVVLAACHGLPTCLLSGNRRLDPRPGSGKVWRSTVIEALEIFPGGVVNARIPARLLLLGLLALFLTAGTASAGVRFHVDSDRPSNPPVWVWDVLIAVVAFVAGFLVAATIARSGGIRLTSRRHGHRRRTEAGWNRISRRIRAGTEQGLTEWRGTERVGDADWGNLSRKIEECILDEMRNNQD
jgi:hypothetical protein